MLSIFGGGHFQGFIDLLQLDHFRPDIQCLQFLAIRGRHLTIPIGSVIQFLSEKASVIPTNRECFRIFLKLECLYNLLLVGVKKKCLQFIQ